jgi:hypothetical protein
MLAVIRSSQYCGNQKDASQRPLQAGATLSLSLSCIRLLIASCCIFLMACGGGGGSSNPSPSSSPVANSSSPAVQLGGQVTYDFVPHNANKIGLNYSDTSARPGRGLLVELLDSNNLILATANTDDLGYYSFNVELKKPVKIRVKAQLLRTQLPVWNFKVTDNTSGNNVYAMDGALVEVNDATAVRNLHAASGWRGTGYNQPRVAAPFAILDSIYEGLERIVAVNNSLTFLPLELRWSVRNKAAEGNVILGEIGTSYYDDSAIYILGD